MLAEKLLKTLNYYKPLEVHIFDIVLITSLTKKDSHVTS